MPSIFELIPNPDDLLALEPEELAGPLLQSLASPGSGDLNRYNYSLPTTVQRYPRERQNDISKALMEAWVWLEREGLLAPKPGEQGDWVFITRRGKQLATQENFDAYRRAAILPKKLLHPVIIQKCAAAFLRGDYDTCVFQAFKEIEIAVRDAGGFPTTEIGASLMRRAFAAGNGPLTNTSDPVAEQDSMAHLFAGALGCYKNPHSHRSVSIDAQEAAELLLFATHLLGIVDKRRPRSEG